MGWCQRWVGNMKFWSHNVNYVARSFSPRVSLRQLSTKESQYEPYFCKTVTEPAVFNPKKILILTKLTRYEFEKRRHSDLTEKELEDVLRKRGSDYKMLIYHHNVHKNCAEIVNRSLEQKGIETKVVTRFDYSEANIQWADAIVTTGGDGTFLLAASKIMGCDKPVIGFNSDPTRSEGYLCLPKKYSTLVPEAVDKLREGKFRWMHRKRLRVTLIGDKIYEPPVELHDQQLAVPEYRFMDCLQEQFKASSPSSAGNSPDRRVLPVLALNEVYIGETLSARVSYYELSVDNSERSKVKSSGLCICTGTGSTSWAFNINKLTHISVAELLTIVKEETGLPMDPRDSRLVDKITGKFNNDLIFSPEVSMMAYTIRDPVSDGTLPVPGERKPRGFATRIEVRSRCFDACLVIDGGLSYRFNDGTRAIIELREEDALKTVVLNET